MDNVWSLFKQDRNSEQQTQLNENGFAYLTDRQVDLMYGDRGQFFALIFTYAVVASKKVLKTDNFSRNVTCLGLFGGGKGRINPAEYKKWSDSDKERHLRGIVNNLVDDHNRKQRLERNFGRQDVGHRRRWKRTLETTVFNHQTLAPAILSPSVFEFRVLGPSVLSPSVLGPSIFSKAFVFGLIKLTKTLRHQDTGVGVPSK